MENELQLKEIVRESYGKIAIDSEGSCCSSGCGCGGNSTFMNEDYNSLNGYNPDADLGLGCGLPTNFARIKEGGTVVDLGSGAGNGCFVARAEAGENGKIVGIDFTPEMIAKAQNNAQNRGFPNKSIIRSLA